MATEPRVAQVRHAANVAHLIHLRECPAWGKKCHKCGNKNHFSMCCRTRDREDSKDRDQHRLTHRESWSKRRSRSRHRRHASEDLEDRSRSRSTTQSAHSIQQNSFQDHPDLHGRHPFEINDFVKKTFHSISRSKSVASISNDDGSRWQNQDPHNPEHQAATPKWHWQCESQSWRWCRG